MFGQLGNAVAKHLTISLADLENGLKNTVDSNASFRKLNSWQTIKRQIGKQIGPLFAMAVQL